MAARRVCILGGGPGGLYLAAVLRRRHPRLEVVVHERNEPGATFGFGVGLSGRTRGGLSRTDPEIFEELMAVGVFSRGHEFQLPSGPIAIASPAPVFLVGRSAMLEVLARTAVERGVELSLGHEVRAEELDGDVVVAADGANSATRRSLEAELGVEVALGTELYLWCGADFALPRNAFIPVQTEHGVFVAHAYPYSPDRSTFLIETDEETWRRARFDEAEARLASATADASDEASMAYLQEAFAAHLDGHSLLGNRTRWLRFPSIRAERWHHGRTVLLGDAIHTAHYSIGSGTKLAMEDAITLADALDFDDLPRTFRVYQARRRPHVRRLQHVARRSQLWWRSFPQRMHRPAAEIAVSFMTRAGAVSLEQLQSTNAPLVVDALSELSNGSGAYVAGGDTGRWVAQQEVSWGNGRSSARMLALERPVVALDEPTPPAVVDARAAHGPDAVLVAMLPVATDDVHSPEADALLATADELAHAGADGVCLTGPPKRNALMDRAALAERLRAQLTCRVVVQGSERDLDVLTASIAAGRADAVVACEQ
jgi:anthraniloyl-CoA monooxygenase